MADDTSGIIDIDAKSLTELTEEMRKICAVKGEEEKELIEELTKKIHSKYKTDINKSVEKKREKKQEPVKKDDKEKKEEKEQDLGFFKGVAKKFIKKVLSPKTQEEKAAEKAKLKEERQIAEMENRIAIAANRLRSNQGVDSKQNDLNIMKDMVEVVEIAADAKVPPKVAEEARQAIGKVSLVTGGSANTVKQEAYREERESAGTGVSSFMRQKFQNKTKAVEFGPPVTPGQKEIEDRNYEKGAEALANKKRREG